MLISALQLKLTLFYNDKVDLYTTLDHKFINAFLKNAKSRLFRHTYFLRETINLLESDICMVKEKHAAYFATDDYLQIASDHFRLEDTTCFQYSYDIIITMGNFYFPYWLCAINRRRGNKTQLQRLCDGVVYKYSPINIHFDNIFLNELHMSGYLDGGFQTEYIFHPDVLEMPTKNIIEIPPIIKGSEAYDSLFRLSSEHRDCCRRKHYIYFTSATIHDYNCYENETEIIIKLKERVGSENLLIQPHPRRNLEDLKKIGVSFVKNLACAEYLYTQILLSETTFVSMGTNAVFTPYEMFQEHPKRVILLDRLLVLNKNIPGISHYQQDKLFYEKMVSRYQQVYPDIYIQI